MRSGKSGESARGCRWCVMLDTLLRRITLLTLLPFSACARVVLALYYTAELIAEDVRDNW